MANYIKLEANTVSEIMNEVQAMISGRFLDGILKYEKKLEINKRCNLTFSDIAWAKMNALISGFDSEVAWHGFSRKDGNNYFIDDIVVYPQNVSSATVTTDQEEYEKWLAELNDDEFNSLRFQGHSHVNMSTSPSGVDTSLYDRILSQLTDEDFYIFAIWNKKGEHTVYIYDMVDNIKYDTKDIDITVETLSGFLENAQDLVKKETYTTTSPKKNDDSKSDKKKSDNKKSEASESKAKYTPVDYNYYGTYSRYYGYDYYN